MRKKYHMSHSHCPHISFIASYAEDVPFFSSDEKVKLSAKYKYRFLPNKISRRGTFHSYASHIHFRHNSLRTRTNHEDCLKKKSRESRKSHPQLSQTLVTILNEFEFHRKLLFLGGWCNI